jgi:hypothetical protein
MPTTPDPFALACPRCHALFDPTDPAVEMDFAAGFAAAAPVCPCCGTACRNRGGDDA